jgi:hypothetical protein
MNAVAPLRHLFFFLADLLALFPVTPIYAGCSNPIGNEKDIIYNDHYHTYEFCDGTRWISMGKPITARAGVSGNGYFVMTKTVYNGNFNSNGDNLNAPDARCLTELTTETAWRGYSAANANGQLVAEKVHAFLCTERICSKLTPLSTYYFANAADGTVGGASFTTDANGDGPNNSEDWSAANHFHGNYIYWTGYRGPNTDSSWTDIPTGGGYQCKTRNAWDSETNRTNGVFGSSTFSNKDRWWAGNDTCDHFHYLICYVNP